MTHRVLTLGIPVVKQDSSLQAEAQGPLTEAFEGISGAEKPRLEEAHEVLQAWRLLQVKIQTDKRSKIKGNLGFHLPIQSVNDSVEDPET